MRKFVILVLPPVLIVAYAVMLLRDKDTSFRDFTPVFWGLLAWSIAADRVRRYDLQVQQRARVFTAVAEARAQDREPGGGIAWRERTLG